MTHRPQCMARLASTLSVSPAGFPLPGRVRCSQTVGVTVWTGAHGQTLAACGMPGHRADVEAQDAPYRVEALGTCGRCGTTTVTIERHPCYQGVGNTDLAERARHDWEEDERDDDRIERTR